MPSESEDEETAIPLTGEEVSEGMIQQQRGQAQPITLDSEDEEATAPPSPQTPHGTTANRSSATPQQNTLGVMSLLQAS